MSWLCKCTVPRSSCRLLLIELLLMAVFHLSLSLFPLLMPNIAQNASSCSPLPHSQPAQDSPTSSWPLIAAVSAYPLSSTTQSHALADRAQRPFCLLRLLSRLQYPGDIVVKLQRPAHAHYTGHNILTARAQYLPLNLSNKSRLLPPSRGHTFLDLPDRFSLSTSPPSSPREKGKIGMAQKEFRQSLSRLHRSFLGRRPAESSDCRG